MGNLNAEAWTRQALGECADAIWRCDTLEKANLLIHSRPTPILLPNFIAGELSLPSSASTSFIDSYEPKTGALLCRLPCAQPQDVDAAIRHARAAFPAWSKTTRAERSRHLRRVSELLQEHREVFAVWESIDQGKTLGRARIEVDRAIANFSYVTCELRPSGLAAIG
jgi:acyl-CoA reductase-like NAD-dependent aldehyde dehydrogenase